MPHNRSSSNVIAAPLRLEVSYPVLTILASPIVLFWHCREQRIAEQRGKDEKPGNGSATPKA